MSKNVTGLVFTCDHNGIIQEVLTDSCGLLEHATGCHLEAFTESSSKPKVSDFLDEIITKGAAFLWEMALPKEHGYEVLNFFGGRKNGTLFILAAPAPHSIFTYYDELMRVINDQGTMLRNLQRQEAPPSNKSVQQASTEPESEETSSGQVLSDASDDGYSTDFPVSPDLPSSTSSPKPPRSTSTPVTRNGQYDDSAFSLDEFMQLNNELITVQRELTRKNHQLQEQEERFRRIIHESVDALFVINSDGIILFANPAATRLMANNSGILTGSPFPFTIEDKPYREVDVLREDSPAVPCSMRHTPIQWEKKDALLVSLRDITARKEVEAMREEVDRITRHDLKSPLQGIIGLPELLLLDDNLTDQQREALTMIRESGLRMMNVINSSLNLHKMESGLYDFVPESVELLALLNDVLNDSAVIFRRRKISAVRIRINGKPTTESTTTYVLGERLLLYSLFSNILVNAAEASPPEEIVEMYIRTDGAGDSRYAQNKSKHSDVYDHNGFADPDAEPDSVRSTKDHTGTAENASARTVVIRIRNKGAVPVEIRETFFEKYVSRGKKFGTGLGTYAARLIARTNGGDVTLDALDDTTTVIVTLPKGRWQRH